MAPRAKKAKKAAPGLKVVERDGHWHIQGTCRVGGKSVRVRRSTELKATKELLEEAEFLRLKIEQEVRDEVIHGVKPTQPLAIAARDYLNRPRERHLSASDINAIKHVVREFGTRMLREIAEEEWDAFVRRRMEGRKSSTRERYINTILAFLNWCAKRPRQWLDELPQFDRDRKARNPNTRARRRVSDVGPDLVLFMLAHAAPHLKAQMAVEWSTGARVSSILHGCRLCDVILAEGREQITFHNTKNGQPVTASLHPFAARAIADYLEVRGNLHDREGPLFLTDEGKPYSPGRGPQNKTAFNGMKRRAAQALRDAGAEQARELRREGLVAEARAVVAEVREQAFLLSQVTQHWFRHMLADTLLKNGADIRTVMEQGGWLDPKSVMGYTRDVADHRRRMVNNLPLGTSLTREDEEVEKKA